MLRKTFIVVFLLALICNLAIYKARAQGQPPPLMPPHILYGTAYVDGSPLGESDTDYTVSVRMSRLLLIFLDNWDSQADIAAIIGELDTGSTDALRQEFLDSTYCQSRATTLSGGASITETLANEWRVVDAGTTYTVLSQAIDVWNGIGWIPGSKLEVYEHDGIMVSYIMGEYPVDEYVLELTMSTGTVYGGGDSLPVYVIREPGKVIAGEQGSININNINITDPVLPYTATEEAFVEMDIYAPSTYTFTINLEDDWNMFSVPIEPLDTDIVEVLSPLAGKYESVAAYDTETDTWLVYNPVFIVSTLNEIRAGVGYWIKMNQAGQSLTVEGTEPATTTMVLKKGWNLVGYKSLNGRDIVQAITSVAAQCETVSLYDSATDTWLVYNPVFIVSTLTSMSPGYAYWMKILADDVLWDVGQFSE